MKEFFDILLANEKPYVFLDDGNLQDLVTYENNFDKVKSAYSSYIQTRNRKILQLELNLGNEIPKEHLAILNDLDYLIDKVGTQKVKISSSNHFTPFGDAVLWLGGGKELGRKNSDKADGILSCFIYNGLSTAVNAEMSELLPKLTGVDFISSRNALLTAFEQYVIPELLKREPAGLAGTVGFNFDRVVELAKSLSNLKLDSTLPGYPHSSRLRENIFHIRFTEDDPDQPDLLEISEGSTEPEKVIA